VDLRALVKRACMVLKWRNVRYVTVYRKGLNEEAPTSLPIHSLVRCNSRI